METFKTKRHLNFINDKMNIFIIIFNIYYKFLFQIKLYF